MEPTPAGLSADEAERRIASMLEADDLPMFVHSIHNRTANMLELSWGGGSFMCFDLECDELEPFDEGDREFIRGEGMGCGCPPIDVTVPGSPTDPRDEVDVPGVRVHHVPELHPDDTATVDGIPCTSPSRTLIDLAEVMEQDELRDVFARARERGMLDREALLASRARVEWRPSLQMLDEVIEEFCG